MLSFSIEFQRQKPSCRLPVCLFREDSNSTNGVEIDNVNIKDMYFLFLFFFSLLSIKATKISKYTCHTVSKNNLNMKYCFKDIYYPLEIILYYFSSFLRLCTASM